MYLSYDIDMNTEIIISICKSYESEAVNIIIKILTSYNGYIIMYKGRCFK